METPENNENLEAGRTEEQDASQGIENSQAESSQKQASPVSHGSGNQEASSCKSSHDAHSEEHGTCGKRGACNGCSDLQAKGESESNREDASGEDNGDYDNGHDAGDSDELISRSNFIRTAFCCTALAWGGVALAPIAAYLIPPAGEDDSASKITSVEVCKLSELPKGTGRNFRFGSYPALLIHTLDGNLHAFKAVCTHLGCTVQFRSDKQCIYCACHGGEYNTEGKNVAGPPPKPLPELKVSVVEGKIVVSKA